MADHPTIRRVLAGDPLVIEQLRGWIRAACAAYAGRLRLEIEDVEQEVLADLTENLRAGRFRGESTLRTYVRSLAQHKCIDTIRAGNRRTWIDVEDLELPDLGPSPLRRAESRQTVSLALRVAAEMPESCRELWKLLLEGWSYREMSRRLGVKEGALRARVLRCRRQALALRERLQRPEKEPPD